MNSKHNKIEEYKKTNEKMSNKMLGRRLKLPLMTTIFESKRNPLHDTNERKAMCALAYEFSSMSAKTYWRMEDICLYTAYFHPFTKDVTKYVNLCRVMQVYTIIDDHTECDWGDLNHNLELSGLIWKQLEQSFEKLLDDKDCISMAKWKPYVVLQYICYKEIFNDCSEVQKRRIAKEFLLWGHANAKDNNAINNGNGFDSIDQYIEFRKISLGFRSVVSFVEYADGIEITDEEWDTCMPFIEMCASAAGLTNDILSFEKELRDQEDRPDTFSNAVGLIMKLENCSMEDAFKRTVVMINDCEENIQQMKNKLLQRQNLSPDMKIFIDRVTYLVAGNLIGGLELRRYGKVHPINE